MTAVEQVAAAGRELACEVQRRHALAKATENQPQAAGPVTDSFEFGARIEVEDLAALPTTIIDHRRPMAIMWGLIRWQRVPHRAAQPLGVQGLQQRFVAPFLIEEVLDREQHHGGFTRIIVGRRVKP
jgi:hypothetical protein